MACSHQEEESLNIWLLTREELYMREVPTLAPVGRRACRSRHEPREAPGHSQQVKTLAEYPRASSQGLTWAGGAQACGQALQGSSEFPCHTAPPRTQSHPMEFKAWNFSLKFLTLPCWPGSAGSLGPSSFGQYSGLLETPVSWKSRPRLIVAAGELGPCPLRSSSPAAGQGRGPFSRTITRWLFSRVRSAVTYRASSSTGLLWGSIPGSWGWAASGPGRPLLAPTLQQRPTLPAGGGSTMFSGTERLRLTGGPRGRLPSAWKASSWEAYLEQSSRTSGQLKGSASKGLRGLREEGRGAAELAFGLAAVGLKAKSRGEPGLGGLCSWAAVCSWLRRGSTGFLFPVRRERAD